MAANIPLHQEEEISRMARKHPILPAATLSFFLLLTLISTTTQTPAQEERATDTTSSENPILDLYQKVINGKIPLDQAIALAERSSKDWAADTTDIAVCLNKVASLFEEQNYQDAYVLASLTWEVARKSASSRLQAASAHALADAIFYTGDKRLADKRIDLYNLALEYSQSEGNKTAVASIHNSLGTAYSDLPTGDRGENLQKAIQCYHAALEIRTKEQFPTDYATTQNNLGTAYQDLPTGDRGENLQKAIQCYNAALEIYTREQFPVYYALTQNNMGYLYWSEDRYPEAHQAYREALGTLGILFGKTLTRTGQRGLAEEMAKGYRKMAYTCSKLGKHGEAVEWLERGKCRLYSQSLAQRDATSPKADPEDVKEFHELVRRIENLERTLEEKGYQKEDLEALAQARADLAAVSERISKADPDFLATAEPINLEQTKALVPDSDSTALVIINVTEKGGTAYFLYGEERRFTENDVIPLYHFSKDSLNQLLFEDTLTDSLGKSYGAWLSSYARLKDARAHYHAALEELKSNPCHESLNKFEQADKELKMAKLAWTATISFVTRELYSNLWNPIIKHIGTRKPPIKHIVLLTDGALRLLPLHAAHYDSGGQKHYVLEKYTISYAPSCYVLDRCKGRYSRMSKRGVLAIANPTRDLPCSEVEAYAIASLTSEAYQVLRGFNATCNKIKYETTRFGSLHFSCHGLYNWENPLESYLMVANKDHLTLSDVQRDIDLRGSRLVTLSACETGIVDAWEQAADYVGMAAGFLQAGAPAVVSPLWAVHEISTALLMDRFYQEMQNDLSPAEALQKAQLWMLQATTNSIDAAKRSLLQRAQKNALWASSGADTLCEQRLYPLPSQEAQQPDRPYSHSYYWASCTLTGWGG
jgi:CHAT domain-containing protein